MGLAPIFAPLFGGWLLLVASWRAIFWVLTGFAVLVGLAVFFKLPESRSEATAVQARAENPFRAYVALSRSPRLIGYTLAGALNGAVLFTYISSSPDLIMGHFHVSPQAFGWLFMLNAFGLIGASQVNRWLLRRLTPDQVLARASLTSIGFGVLLLITAITGFGGMWGIVVTLFLTLATFGLMQGNTMAGALSVDPVRAGSVSALVGGVSFGTGALASWLGSVLHNGTPVPMAGVMLGSMVASGLCLFLLAFRKAGPSP
jgi:DHA1 family bicyclomycin/chloramphenicol resistance-like MFS transporter